jgi:hypothetical protein
LPHQSISALLVVLASFAGAAHAVTPLSADERNVVHFAFGTQLGSGVYVISGRTLQIYKLPFGYQLREPGPDGIGIRLTLPVTIGFIGFKPVDVVDTGLPQNLDSLSFVPGLEFDIPVTSRWRLEPFAEAGVARDRTSEFDERVFAVGLRSRVALGGEQFDWTLFNELVHVGVDLEQSDRTDDFTRFRTGLTARQVLGRSVGGHQADVLWYALHEWYVDAPDGLINGEEGAGTATQVELGLTFGTTQTVRLWRIPLPRVGLGYRFGGDLGVFRLVFGSPF